METADITSGEIASAVKDAAAAVASPAQHTEDTTGKADAATREPSGVPEPKPEDRYKGWLPPEAHERVVDGFHKRLDAVAWASGLNPDDVRDALALKRQLADRAKVSAEPAPDTKDERGDPYYTPQQAAKWAAWKADQIVSEKMREIEQRIGPIERTFAETKEMQTLSAQIQEAKQWPGFEDHLEAITKVVLDGRKAGHDIGLHEAYIHVVPKALAESGTAHEAELKKKWLAELNATHASTKQEVNPGRAPASSSPKKDSEMSISELMADEVAKRRKAS